MPPSGLTNQGGAHGGGRKKGVIKRYQVKAELIGHRDYLPIEYMLALMRDESAEPHRRDAMAVQAAPYVHARLNAVATSAVAGRDKEGGGDVNIIQIFAVPRGAALDLKSGQVLIEGKADVELTPVEPYEGTPPLRSKELVNVDNTGTSPPVAGLPQHEPLPVFDVDVANVTRLDTYRRDED